MGKMESARRRLNAGSMESQKKRTVTQRSLNDLPINILCCIVALLPIKEAIRTSILSKIWRYLWLWRPNWELKFSAFPRMRNKRLKFENLIDQIIQFQHQSGGRMKTMKLHHTSYIATSQKACRWINSLIIHKITGLDLEFQTPVAPPCTLFYSSTLVEMRLCLNHLFLHLPEKIFMPSLKILLLVKADFISMNFVDKLLNGCPILVSFQMTDCVAIGAALIDAKISHPTLEELVIDECHLFDCSSFSMSTKNLTRIVYRGLGLVSYKHDLGYMPKLEEVILEGDDVHFAYMDERKDGLTEEYGGRMCRVLRALCSVKYMRLNEWCIEYLSTVPFISSFPYFMNLESLTVSVWPNDDHRAVVAHLVQLSPLLKYLSVEVVETTNYGTHDEERANYPPRSIFDDEEVLHYNLLEVCLRNNRGLEEEMNFIYFLLNTAVVLEKLNIQCRWVSVPTRRKYRKLIKSYPGSCAKLRLSIR